MYNITTVSKRSDNRLFHRIWFFYFDIKPHTSNVAQGPKSRTRLNLKVQHIICCPYPVNNCFVIPPTTDESNISNSN